MSARVTKIRCHMTPLRRAGAGHPRGGRPCPPTVARIPRRDPSGVASRSAPGRTYRTTSSSARQPGRGFIIQPHRWVVERTNGWIDHCRRLNRHYETTLTAHVEFLNIHLPSLLRRTDRSQLFETL